MANSILDQATAAWMAQHPFWLPEMQRPAQPTNVLEIPPMQPPAPPPEEPYGPDPYSLVTRQPPLPQPLGFTGGEQSIFYGQPGYDPAPLPLFRRGVEDVGRVLGYPFEQARRPIAAGTVSALGPRVGNPVADVLTMLLPFQFGALKGLRAAGVAGDLGDVGDLPPGGPPGGPPGPARLPTRPTVPLPGGPLSDIMGNVQAQRGAAGQSAIERFGTVAPGTRPFTGPEIEAATEKPTVPPFPVSPQRFHGSQRGPINVLTRPEFASDPRNIIGPATFTTNDIFEAEQAATSETAIQTTRTQPGAQRRPVYRVDEINPDLNFFRINDYPLSTQQLDKVAANLPETIPDPRFPREMNQKIAVRKRFLRELHGTAKSHGVMEGAARFRAIDLLEHYFNPKALPEERAMRTWVQNALRKTLEQEGYAGIEYEHPAAIPGMPGNVDHIKAYFHPERDIHMTPLPEHEWSMQFVERPGQRGWHLTPQRIGPPEVRPLRPGERPWR